MILAGTFLWSKPTTALAAIGIILAAVYLLWMVQRVAFGAPSPHFLPKLRDLNQREMVTLAPLVVLVFWIGLFPNPILTRMHASVGKVLARAAQFTMEASPTVSRIDPLPPPTGDTGSTAAQVSQP